MSFLTAVLRFECLTSLPAAECSSEHKGWWVSDSFINICYFSERSLAVLVADERRQSISLRSLWPQEVVFTLPGRNSSHSSFVQCPGTDTKWSSESVFILSCVKNRPYVCTLMELSLLMRGLKLFGSLLKVIPSRARKRFIPASRLWGLKTDKRCSNCHDNSDEIMSRGAFLDSYVLAKVCLEGMPSNTMTLSAR